MGHASGLRICAVLWLGLSQCILASHSPPVSISLHTSWAEVPLLLEVLESVSAENPDAFFPLLDTLADPDTTPSLSSLTSEAAYQLVLQAAIDLGALREPGALASVELQVALHAATPKIQAFYQFYADSGFVYHPDCGSWVDWYGERVCDLDTLTRLVGHETIDPPNDPPITSYTRPKVLPFDHIQPSPETLLEPPPRTAIFYAIPSSTNFRQFHSYLSQLSSGPEPRLEYIFRHASIPDDSFKDAVYLSGYGVTLDLKKMDYLALDDRQAGRQDVELEESSSENILADEDLIFSQLENYPQVGILDSNSPLTEEEITVLGIKSTQLIADSSQPLLTLAQLSQNFPKYATSLARKVAVNQTLRDEVEYNRAMVYGGSSAFWLNGLTIQESDLDPLNLLRILRKERDVILSLTSLGMTSDQAVTLLTHQSIYQSQSDQTDSDSCFDASDRQEGKDIITWWNDFEKDSRYARWNPSLASLLRPVYPGSFHNLKRNLFNVILILDLSQTTSLNFLAGPVYNIIGRNIPFHFGVVPLVESDDGLKMARLFYYSVKKFGRAKVMGLFRNVAQISMPFDQLGSKIDWSLVRSEYASIVHESSLETDEEPALDFDTVINGNSEQIDSRLNGARVYVQRLDAGLATCPTGHAFVNGKHFDIDDDFLRNLQTEVAVQLQHIQTKVYLGELGESQVDAIENYFYDLPGTSLSRNRYIHPTGQKGSLKLSNIPEVFSRIGYQLSPSSFIYPAGAEKIPLTTYVLADFDSEAGVALMKEAAVSLESDSLSRLTFVHIPADSSSGTDLGYRGVSNMILQLLMKGALSEISPSDFIALLDQAREAPSVTSEKTQFSDVLHVQRILHERGVNVDAEADSEAYRQFYLKGQLIARELPVSLGSLHVIVNGRIVGPIKPHDFKSADFKMLYEFELQKRVKATLEALTSIIASVESLDKATYSNLISSASSIISAVQLPDPSEQGLFNMNQRPRQRNYQRLRDNGNLTSFEFGDPSTAIYQFGVLVDPISEAAQKWSTLLEWLSTIPSVYAEVYLNPARYTELPLKRFYRYNLNHRLSFDEAGSEVHARTLFNGLPVDPIYTLGMDVPASWLVRPREALHDLDNIQLSSLPAEERSQGVEAIFQLDFIVIEGHARDALTNSPPRGLQLELKTLDSIPIDDTQVVANLGYLQFKAKPGVFKLDIREGRGRDVYVMESVGNEGWHSPNVAQVGNEVTLTSFEGLTLYPRVRRRPGMAKADVLDEFTINEEAPKSLLNGIASRVASLFQPSKIEPVAEKAVIRPQADINIFTVASGLLYERFASIMILSVLRNTNSSVKFWFIENFLSPSFLEFIPQFAEAYGFDYELVTYKWPSWLREQTEKQRIIWAYKILFLDVLFPMDLKKVIFVDADQIVRADLKELVDLDLQGAPYGYTPMGDDNADMEGFRFWKTGYWKDFLHGLPYHISALYVVDLVRFRQMAAGDFLRGQYQQLSADPNSLANLDQDLPNNLQRDIPIFSLHEDWLWCETWCSKDRLHRAKTIDLCQNPLTKEPKLSRARQIPEWEEYDGEIARFARTLADKGLIRSTMAAADANALAGGPPKAGGEQDGEESEETTPSIEEFQGAGVESIGGKNEDTSHMKDEL